MRKLVLIFMLLLASRAESADLLYFEAQGVAGYSSAQHKITYHSAEAHDVMQKNSVGFDYLHKFSGSSGDWGTAALQARFAYNDEQHNYRPQIYNAWLKAKSNKGDFWLGHNRVAFGLASYWDTHADLLGDLTMQGISYDRDWGTGWGYDTENGNISASLTSGTGMNYRAKGNWLAAARASRGVLNRDNYTGGVSFMAGNVLETMGYKIMNKRPQNLWLLGADIALNQDNFEHKFEIDAGEKAHKPLYAAIYRFSLKLDAEERWKLEMQPAYVNSLHEESWQIGGGISYLLTADLTLRLMYQYRQQNADNVYMSQLYYYLPI